MEGNDIVFPAIGRKGQEASKRKRDSEREEQEIERMKKESLEEGISQPNVTILTQIMRADLAQSKTCHHCIVYREQYSDRHHLYHVGTGQDAPLHIRLVMTSCFTLTPIGRTLTPLAEFIEIVERVNKEAKGPCGYHGCISLCSRVLEQLKYLPPAAIKRPSFGYIFTTMIRPTKTGMTLAESVMGEHRENKGSDARPDRPDMSINYLVHQPPEDPMQDK